MGHVHIHRTRRPGSGFAAVPDYTARNDLLSWAARGYLTEMLSNSDDWYPETAVQAARRAKRYRAENAESARLVSRILAELEREGYRHRVRRRHGSGSAFVSELHYYDLPVQPCEDAATCDSCRLYCIAAGRSESAELRTPADQAEQGVSAGRSECAVSGYPETAGSIRRQTTTGDQTGDLHNTPEQQQLASLAALSEPLASLGGSDHIGDTGTERTRRVLASVPDLPPDPYDYDDWAQRWLRRCGARRPARTRCCRAAATSRWSARRSSTGTGSGGACRARSQRCGGVTGLTG